MEPFLYFLAGSLVSWLITMVYYRKSSVKWSIEANLAWQPKRISVLYCMSAVVIFHEKSKGSV